VSRAHTKAPSRLEHCGGLWSAPGALGRGQEEDGGAEGGHHDPEVIHHQQHPADEAALAAADTGGEDAEEALDGEVSVITHTHRSIAKRGEGYGLWAHLDGEEDAGDHEHAVEVQAVLARVDERLVAVQRDADQRHLAAGASAIKCRFLSARAE
jgi:hypothetical protein